MSEHIGKFERILRDIDALSFDGMHTAITELGWVWNVGTAVWDGDDLPLPEVGSIAAHIYVMEPDECGDVEVQHAYTGDGKNFGTGDTAVLALRDILRRTLVQEIRHEQARAAALRPSEV